MIDLMFWIIMLWLIGACAGFLCAQIPVVYFGATPHDPDMLWLSVVLPGLMVAYALFDKFVPCIPGYCYTAMFVNKSRVRMAFKFGPSPEAVNLKTLDCFDQEARFRYQFYPGGYVHVVRTNCGLDVSELMHIIPDSERVGSWFGKSVMLPALYGYEWVIRVFRLIYWYNFMKSAPNWLIMITGVCIGGAWLVNTKSVTPLFLGLLLIHVTSKNSFELLLWLLLWFGFHYSIDYMSSGMVKLALGEDNLSLADIDRFPKGEALAQTPFKYSFNGNSRNYALGPFKMDTALTGEDLDAFLADAPQRSTKMITSGNPHVMAAQLRAYMRYEFAKKAVGKLVWIVGGSFLGFSKTLAGVAFRPCITSGDVKRVQEYRTNSGLGRLVSNHKMSTAAGPVNGPVENYTPLLTMEGLGGAVAYMEHVYDIPVRDFVANLYANNSEVGYVVMHFSPEIFRYESGLLPWSKQEWRHNSDGTSTFCHLSTCGPPYVKSTRLYMEHLLTEFIAVVPGVWYCSNVEKSVLDTLMISWRRTEVQPVWEKFRSFPMRKRPESTTLPTVSKGGANEQYKAGLTSSVHFREYLHMSKSEKEWSNNMRMLVDNIKGRGNPRVEYLAPEELRATWNAKEIIEVLAEYNTPSKQFWGWSNAASGIVGLTADYSLMSGVAERAFLLFVSQRKTKEVVPTWFDDKPFVSPLVVPKDVVKRVERMPDLTVPTGSVLDGKVLSTLSLDSVKLFDCGVGHKGLLTAIFGNAQNRSILPCGLAHLGGSYLSTDEPGLLKTELEYLMQSHSLVIIDTSEPETKIWGNPSLESPVVVVVNLEDGVLKVNRLYYPKNVSFSDVVDKYGAKLSDFAEVPGWFNALPQVDRVYSPNPHTSTMFMAEQEKCKAKILAGINNPQINAERKAELPIDFEFDVEWVKEGDHLAETKTSSEPFGVKAYDQTNLIDGRYLPPHTYYHMSVANMRKLTGPMSFSSL